ncbi:MAG: DNA-3-methyladenine glycosylase [Bacteroidales bacterium]|nr:DNA-3-methyladenine glycosylase [Bacteroidales bacterium]MBN2633391.1 DNA-3-methyladenine glycosylase [Bacteroidales bacterium]
MTGSPIDIISGERLKRDFYVRDVLFVAPELIGKILVVRNDSGLFCRYIITETEAYRGDGDEACHASRGRTARTEVMYHEGGKIYVYFVYGMYWMLNFVAGERDNPQAALIRGISGFKGPGKLTRELKIDKSYYGEDMITSERIWVEDAGLRPDFKTGPRIGINYAGEVWKNKPWRFFTG